MWAGVDVIGLCSMNVGSLSVNVGQTAQIQSLNVVSHRVLLSVPRHDVIGLPQIDLYAARFQIEFLFRDSKQFTGLLDCQARAATALDFHFNASLATLNLVRAEDLCMQPGQKPHVFSMASWKQCQFNERLLDIL